MAAIESPSDPKVQAEIDPSFLAGRVSLRPLEFRAHGKNGILGGHYRRNLTSGLTTTLNAGDALLSLRWDSPDRAFVLLRALVQATIATAFGAAQETSVDLVKVNNFTAPDSSGTAATLGNDSRLSPIIAPSQVADLRVCGATALGAGTGVAEAAPLAFSALPIGNALGASAKDILFDAIAGQDHPLVLNAKSGFRIRVGFTQGAAGVVRFNFTLVWAEVPLGSF